MVRYGGAVRAGDAVRVKHLGEVAADEQATGTGLEFPHTVDRVEVRIEGEKGAGSLRERKELAALGGVGVVVRVIVVPVDGEVGVRGGAVEQELVLGVDHVAVGAHEEGVALGFKGLDVAAEHSLPLADAGEREGPHRIAVVAVV